MTRIDLDEYFMRFAHLTKLRGTCKRKQVGSVIVLNNNVVSTGYNGSASGAPHCTEAGCLVVNNSCLRCSHSEENSVINAMKNNSSVVGATIYVTTFPCFRCIRLLRNAGIVRIVYSEMYHYTKEEEIILNELRKYFEWKELKLNDQNCV